MEFVRLPLEGATNVREMGGYPTLDGKVTHFKTFIRGSRLKDITENDNEFLKNYGITDIIDLRGNTKIQDSFISDDNINLDYFQYHYIPLSTVETEEYIKKYAIDDSFDFGEGYYLLLENKEKIAKVFKILANAKGAVLYHCTAGKDRTGVISALLLGICNVSDLDIIANYETSYTYLMNEEFILSYDPFSRVSKAKFMSTFIKRLKENYGTFENYILSCGVTEDEINKIKKKFLQNII